MDKSAKSAKSIMERTYKETNDYQRGYHEGLQKGLEELIKYKCLEVAPIYFCHNCAKELKIEKKVEELK